MWPSRYDVMWHNLLACLRIWLPVFPPGNQVILDLTIGEWWSTKQTQWDVYLQSSWWRAPIIERWQSPQSNDITQVQLFNEYTLKHGIVYKIHPVIPKCFNRELLHVAIRCRANTHTHVCILSHFAKGTISNGANFQNGASSQQYLFKFSFEINKIVYLCPIKEYQIASRKSGMNKFGSVIKKINGVVVRIKTKCSLNVSMFPHPI